MSRLSRLLLLLPNSLILSPKRKKKESVVLSTISQSTISWILSFSLFGLDVKQKVLTQRKTQKRDKKDYNIKDMSHFPCTKSILSSILKIKSQIYPLILSKYSMWINLIHIYTAAKIKNSLNLVFRCMILISPWSLLFYLLLLKILGF